MLLENYDPTIQVTTRLAAQAMRHGLWERVGDMHFVRDMLESEQVLAECTSTTKKLEEMVR